MSRFATIRRPWAVLIITLTIGLVTACVWSVRPRSSSRAGAGELPPRFRVTTATIDALRTAGVPGDELAAIQPLVGTHFGSETALRSALGEVLRPTQVDVAVAAADQSDIDLYRDVVVRMREGAGYYQALGAEFEAMEVRASSAFNWRLPTWAWLARALTPGGSRALLIALVLIALGMWYMILRTRRGLVGAVVGLILLLGAFGWCVVGGGELVTETWAGVLIALSLGSYALDRWPVAAATGLLALGFRELALPYCLLCLAIAIWRRRWPEAAVWAIGLGMLACLWMLHARAAAANVAATGTPATLGWLQLGGLRQAVATTRINVVIGLLPVWIAAALLPLSLIGLAGWPDWPGVRMAVAGAGYAFAFALVGYGFNAYWGLLYAPVLALGLVAFPAAARDVGLAAAGLRPSSGSRED